MAVTNETFRLTFPEFKDRARFPEALLTAWVSFASKLVDPARWGDLADMGVMLLAAHNISLSAKSFRASAYGREPGMAQGMVSSKSVDGVSVSYDTSTSSEEGAGQFNLTQYGQRYASLRRLMGAGPVYVGGDGSQTMAQPWLGPFIY